MNRAVIIILILLIPSSLKIYFPYNFIVWNVGQGQWITFIDSDICYHFDMGGEKYARDAEKICESKANKIFISHLDWDHINFINRFSKNIREVCLIYPRRLIKHLKRISKCSKYPQFIQRVFNGLNKGNKNDSSIVYKINNKVLITGDSPMKLEKVFSSSLKKIDILILGHHGSATSTSIKLLKSINPNIAIASARKKRYGHPHKKVIRKLRKQKIVLLETQKQGHIYLAL